MTRISALFPLLCILILVAGCAAPPAPQPPAPQPAVASEPTAPAEASVPQVSGEKMVFVEGGRFLMGDLYGSDQYAKPVHAVSVPDFYISRYEVTFAEYDRFCAATGRPLPDDEGWGREQRPVVNVTHADAVAYARWLSDQTGETYRLPSEAEWEYAARGGRNTHFWWGMQVGYGNANCRGCGSRWDGQMTAPVGSFTANPYGLHDIHGNVYEWVADSWHEDYVGAPTDGSAWIASDAEQYVSRGGSFLEIPQSLHVYSRNWTAGAQPRSDIGFRVVREE